MKRAYLLGDVPADLPGWEYVTEPPYDGVIIGSLTLGQLLCFREEAVFSALAEGKTVILYTPGLPDGGRNRSLCCAVSAAKRQLQSWGIVLTDGAKKSIITAEQAREMVRSGTFPAPGAVLTPLAREILEGSK